MKNCVFLVFIEFIRSCMSQDYNQIKGLSSFYFFSILGGTGSTDIMSSQFYFYHPKSHTYLKGHYNWYNIQHPELVIQFNLCSCVCMGCLIISGTVTAQIMCHSKLCKATSVRCCSCCSCCCKIYLFSVNLFQALQKHFTEWEEREQQLR